MPFPYSCQKQMQTNNLAETACNYLLIPQGISNKELHVFIFTLPHNFMLTHFKNNLQIILHFKLTVNDLTGNKKDALQFLASHFIEFLL